MYCYNAGLSSLRNYVQNTAFIQSKYTMHAAEKNIPRSDGKNRLESIRQANRTSHLTELYHLFN